MRTQLGSRFVDTYRSTGVLPHALLKKPWTLWPNQFDACLLDDNLTMAQLTRNGGLMECCPSGREKYRQRPWIAMPDSGRKFKPIGVIDLPDLTNPANVGVDIAVLTAQVPRAYDGVITDVVCQVTPPNGGSSGFTEGSGDVTWRLSAGSTSESIYMTNRYLRDMGAITTSLGSLQYPSLVMYGGLRVYASNLVTFWVNFGPNAQANLNPNDNVICSIQGWYWSR